MGNDDPVWTALRKVGPGSRRSALSRWMHDNHDELQRWLRDRRPDWTALARAFTEAGLRSDGGPIRPNTARMAWLRVRGQVAQERAAGTLAPDELAPGVRATSKAPAPPAPAKAPSPSPPRSGSDLLDAIRAEANQRSGKGT